MKQRKAVAYIILTLLIVVLSVLIGSLINRKSEEAIKHKADEIINELEAEESAPESAQKGDSMGSGTESSAQYIFSDNVEGLPDSSSNESIDESIAEFYKNRNRGEDYAEERKKSLIENSLFENYELEQHKYQLTDQIEGYIKELYSERPVSAKYYSIDGHDAARIIMEDGKEIKLRIITVRDGVYDFEEEY